MPDTNGLLTAQDNEKIQSWWRLNWRDPVVCPVCKTSDWGLGSHVVSQCAVTGNISAHLSSLQKMQPHDVFQCCVDRHCRRVWPGRAAARSTANSANWAVFRYTFTAPANIPTVQERLGKWIPAAQHSAAMCLPAQQCGLATWAAS